MFFDKNPHPKRCGKQTFGDQLGRAWRRHHAWNIFTFTGLRVDLPLVNATVDPHLPLDLFRFFIFGMSVIRLSAFRTDTVLLWNIVFRYHTRKMFPPLAPNQVVNRMRSRLFGENETAKSLLNTEQRQQALYQIYHEFCKSETQSCEQCIFFSTEQEDE